MRAFRIGIGLLLLCLLSATAISGPAAAEPQAGGAAGETLWLGLQDFVRLVRDRNEQIAYQEAELAISREAVTGAKAIFEPAFVNSYQYQRESRRNTVQELVSQGFAPEFWERSGNYQAALEGLVPTGARLRLGYTRKDFTNSIEQRYGVLRESQTGLGVNLTQPLLRGAGTGPTLAGIRMAEADSSIAFQNYRGQMMRVISEAISAYWDLHLVTEKLRVREESARNADRLLQDNRARVEAGKMAETEVLDALATLAARRSQVAEARQALVAATNGVRTFFSSAAGGPPLAIRPTERADSGGGSPDFNARLTQAFRFRAEYLAGRKRIEREEIRLAFAENQGWPQLDLKGSYTLNGLADTPGSSLDDAVSRDYRTWFVGLELRILLDGDRKGRSELEATRQRKRQALLEMKAIEVSLANTVDTAVRNVNHARIQIVEANEVAELNRRLLEAEIARFLAGKSNSRLLLEREESFNRTAEAQIESRVRYQKALLQLDYAAGTVLVNHGGDVTEAGSSWNGR